MNPNTAGALRPFMTNAAGALQLHPVTQAPLQAIGFRRNGDPMWPVAGGSQPFGDPNTPNLQQPVVGGMPMQTPGLAPIPTLGGGTGVPQQQAGQPQQMVPGQGQQPYGAPAPYGQPGPAPQQQFPFGAFQQPQQGGQPGQPQQQGVAQQVAVPSPLQFAMQHGQVPPPQGQPGQGQQQQAGQGGGQNGGQQQPGQGGQPGQGQQQGQNNGGAWDRPYPQGVPVEQMTVEQQRDYWKYHSRKNETLATQRADYDQLKAQYDQLRAATATEWQRAEMAAEQRGQQAAMQQAAAQLVAFAFQTAAKDRTTPEAISAQLAVLDPMRFVQGGQVNLDAVQNYVNLTWPAQQAPQQQMQPLWMQPGQGQPGVPFTQPGQPQQGYLMPGQPGYGQQPTFGPAGGQQPGVTYPVPGVPQQYPQQPQQVAAAHQPVIGAAGMAGLPGLPQPGQQQFVTDFGQGRGAANPQNGLAAGAAVAAARHGGKTRSQQLEATQTSR